MNIAIIGRTHILLSAAKHLREAGHKVKLIITAKEAPEYQASVLDYQKFAKKISAYFMETPKINEKIKDISKVVKKHDIQIGLSMNYVNVISQEIIDLFPLGILNAHLGDLPKYRGNATINWAIINREPKLALCVHRMVGGELDSGDIITRAYKNIALDTKVTEFYLWMEEKTPILFEDALVKLNKNPKYFLEKQSKKPSDILRCYPRIPADSQIDWQKNNVDILALINASTEPFQGAYTFYDDQKIIIWDAELYLDKEKYLAIPGQIAKIDQTDSSIILICGQGKLKIKEIQIDNYRGAPSPKIKSIRKRFNS